MFALLYQFWFYILSPENEWSQYMVAAILGETGSSIFFPEISHNPGAFIEFYDAKQLFYDHSTFNNFTLP